ncbi:MAG: glycosyltransferase family 4 protein, partial [Fidelibacterota bacterium]
QKLNYDLIIASSTPLTVAIPALWFMKIKRIKLVFEVRDLWPQLPIAIGALKSTLLIRVAQWLEKKTYANSEHVIVLSTGMALELKGIIPSNKLSIITNLSDIDRFQVSDKNGIAFRSRFPGISDSPLVVYTGSFGRINGVTYLIKIAREMKDLNPKIKFLLAGNGFEKEKIEKQSKDWGLLDNYIFISDYLPKKEMPNLLSAATITSSFFIDLPEMEHNSANKFFDGLAAGKPIMINYGGWQAELLKKSGAGFIIAKNDPLKAANQLNDLLLDKERLNNMGIASLKLSKHYDINTNYKKFEKVIDHAYNS